MRKIYCDKCEEEIKPEYDYNSQVNIEIPASRDTEGYCRVRLNLCPKHMTEIKQQYYNDFSKTI